MAISFSKGHCNRIYNILGGYAGALEKDRVAFVIYHSSEITLPSEWLFRGDLGPGGKFLVQQYDGMYVTCFKEDETPERLEIIEKVNVLLKGIYNFLE